MQAETLEALVRAGRKRLLYHPSPAHALDVGRSEIENLVPHREPFLLVDRVTAADPGGMTAAGSRRIDPADPIFRGHFPGEPLYPGVLQLEMMGQLGLCLLGLIGHGPTAGGAVKGARPARFLKVHHAIFLAPVHPGDELTILVKLIEADEYTAQCAGQIVRGETICAFAVMEVYFVEA